MNRTEFVFKLQFSKGIVRIMKKFEEEIEAQWLRFHVYFGKF